MRFFLAIGLYLVVSGLASASFDLTCLLKGDIEKNLRDHVEFLSSELLAGRLTGSTGEKKATDYIAKIFLCLGLEPAGDKGTFFQDFDFTSGVSFGPGNRLAISNQQGETINLKLDEHWRPLSFSDTVAFKSTELVFAGYGITAPGLGALPAYDSYQGLNVKDKWVVVFRYTPEKMNAAQSLQLNPYASPRYKVFTAKDHGAKGIIFVSGPNSKVQNELIPLSFDASLAGTGIVAISVNDKTLDDLLKNSHHSLKKLQGALDLGEQVVLPTITNIKILGQIDIKHIKKKGRNVLARLRVNSHATQTLVIGAHADHLGHGELSGSRSLNAEKGMIHYGADDNASGVASVLEAAAILSNMNAHGKLNGNKEILFAIWSGEELGLLGSNHFVKKAIEHAKNNSLKPLFVANINLDMVGRLRKSLVLQGFGSSSEWPRLIKKVNRQNPIPLITQKDPYLPTDSTSFYLQGVPTINFFTGSHDEYHTIRDTPATLNYLGMKRITQLLVDLIVVLEKESGTMQYQQVAKSRDSTERGFRVYFGTIPDYASADVSGVRLSGVTKNSPADQAGIKANDIIIKLSGKMIHDIYDYTFVLKALHVGESAPLVVRRGQQKITFTIIGRSRE